MKISFGMIVFEGDYVLKECLEQIYPHAHQIVVAEGPVKFWQDRGKSTSGDRTNNILNNFPDPENKISVTHGQYTEKDDQCNAYMSKIKEDTDYLWMVDSDEIYKTDDILKTIEFLKEEKPTSIGVKSCTFYGGFDYKLTGFEENVDNFIRIFKYQKGCDWLTHRPPTIRYKQSIKLKHIDSDSFYDLTGVLMYHYSYVFDKQVKNKIQYYESKVSKLKCIKNYYQNVFLPWVHGGKVQRILIENKYNGVHEWRPEFRGPCKTQRFIGTHPKSITKSFGL
tara:strand:- start:1018 stop:1857 length:840 start_codon:yes stop_codon:yes gene_type:complete